MLPLVRSRDPKVVPAALCGEKRTARETKLLQMWHGRLKTLTTESPDWKTDWWKTGKDLLKAEAFGKCAYCESPTDVVAHGDVEHYRPKADYWWLAYCLDNHLYACQICNQSFKVDHFPLPAGVARMVAPALAATTTATGLAGLVNTFAPDPVAVTAGYPLATFVAACLAEQAGLPDPYTIDPTVHFQWEADEVNKEVAVRPRTNSVRNRFVVASCEKYLGLNRVELRRWRWRLAYKHLARYKGLLAGVTGTARQETLDSMQEMMAKDEPYAAMVRYFVNDKWKLGLPVPP